MGAGALNIRLRRSFADIVSPLCCVAAATFLFCCSFLHVRNAPVKVSRLESEDPKAAPIVGAGFAPNAVYSSAKPPCSRRVRKTLVFHETVSDISKHWPTTCVLSEMTLLKAITDSESLCIHRMRRNEPFCLQRLLLWFGYP